MGILYEGVSNTDDALRKISNEKYDIIFIDYMMHGEDGITALCRIHNTHQCDEIPIVIVTGGNAGLAKQNYLNAGFTGYLEKQFELTTVTSGKLAFEYLENNCVDLILLDIRMPEMDGFTFLTILKQNPLLKDIPVICLTADNEPASELKCFELGAIDFVAKPFVAQIMIQRITRILELGRLQRELQKEVEKKTLALNKRSRQLNRLTIQVMKTLASTIDAKDKYTNGHSIRVAEYSKMIAEKLNMTLREQDDIYYIGLLHDIGKIGIPDEIINKTSRLTDEEYAIIKTHPVIGSEILEKMSELPEIAIGARWHHERFDGKGYPDGLKSDNISLVARIIGVADAYDAMSSKRSYRGVLPQEHIYNEIKRCSGTQFDPIIAEIMLQIIMGILRFCQTQTNFHSLPLYTS